MEKVGMGNNSETTAQKFTSTSRKILVCGFIFIFLAYGLMRANPYLESKWIWLLKWSWLLENVIPKSLLLLGFLSFTINAIVPALLILVFPALGHAWLRGMNSAVVSSKPWSQMSNGAAFWSLLVALVNFALGVLIAYEIIINNKGFFQ